jgi:hypothetical protein
MQHYSTIYISSFSAPTWETHILTRNNNDPFFKMFFLLAGKEEEEEDQGYGQ